MTRRFATSRENIPIYRDGKCTIYTLDENKTRTDKHVGVWFEDRVVGFKRYYTAQSVQVKIDRLIRISKLPGIDNHDRIEIEGDGTYEIQGIQTIFDSTPNSFDLTLKKLEMFNGN